MLKKDIVNLYLNLNKLGTLKGVKFAYGVSRNISLLKPEVEALDKAMEMTEEYKKFDAERMELVKKFAKKDEKGEPIAKDNNYVMEDQKEFEEAFEKLKAENQELFDSRLKQIEEYGELLKIESTVALHKILLSDVPADINVTQMYSIEEIVSEDIPSPYKA